MNSRSGAALIIAIVVLAALLLLGLSFLFTQSGSLSGTRSYSHGQLANLGQDSAQSMGIAAGASALSYRWQQGGVGPLMDDWTDLFYGLGGPLDDSGIRRIGVNHLEFDTRNHRFSLPGAAFLEEITNTGDRDELRRRYPTVVGLSIEDESGKLDPNHLDTRSWSLLLGSPQVGIADWTDGQIPVLDPGRMQLARALATLRYQLRSGRITSLDQLLQAEPPPTIAGTSTPVPNPRRALTRSELERLRPYLSLAVLAQARGGLIDLGTVIGVDGPRVTLDHDQPNALLAFAEAPLLIGAGTTLVLTDDEVGSFAMPATGEAPRPPKVGSAIAIDAPPVVNLHQAEELVRRTFAPGALPPAAPPTAVGNPPMPSLLTELQAMPAVGSDAFGRVRTPFDLLSPLAVIDRLGTTHVLGSRLGDPGAGPFDAGGQSVDSAGIPLLDAAATVLHVKTGSLDRFPTRGYALLEGVVADSTNRAQEVIEYQRSVLPLSASAVATGQEVVLYDVRRGVDALTGRANGSARSFKAGLGSPADLHLTALVAREQQPVGIASQGAITIASAATVTDAAGNQTAQDQHRVVAQALPQETNLEARWDKQATLHALLAQRHGSLVATFPNPYPRLSGVLPQDSPNLVSGTPGVPYVPPADLADLDGSVGIRPAVSRTLVTATHLFHDWSLPFTGTSAQALLVNGNGSPPAAVSATSYSASDITPEGLTLDANRVLAYPNHSHDGLLTDDFAPGAGSPATAGALSPIRGRQFSLWVRPDESWSGMVALLDMRVPNENVGRAYDGTSDPEGSFDGRTEVDNNLVSNRFSLVYDEGSRQLILALNPGIIPFSAPAGIGPAIPRETYGITAPLTNPLPLKASAYPAVDPECLGSGGVHPMSCSSPIATIQHRYQLGTNWLPGSWHQIQVAFSSNQPGGMSIIVDGLVGRDVSRLGSTGTPAAMSVAGDHLTLPTLVLRQDLLATSIKDNGAQAMYVNQLKLDSWAGPAAVKTLLPARGMVRIGNEYISYESIDGAGQLINCVRARRQRTDASMNSDGSVDWNSAHRMEDHHDGDLVVPGGFAIGNIQAGSWFRGGCQLANALPDGDPLKRYTIWSSVVAKTLKGSTQLILAGGMLNDFPSRGFVYLNDQLYFFDNTAGPPPLDPPTTALRNLYSWGSITTADPADPSKTITTQGWVAGLVVDAFAGTEVVVASIELTGDPSPTGAYEGGVVNSGTPAVFVPVEGALQDYQARLVQLYDPHPADASHPNGGRAEWLAYTSIDSRTDYPTSVAPGPGLPRERMSFLLNLMLFTVGSVTEARPGFWFDRVARTGGRGRQRTAFAADDFSTYGPALRFPAKTRVIPVQRNIDIAYLLEAGDIITLTPKVLGSGEQSLQMCVRYSADDGFPETTTSPGWPWNVMNRFFAFTEPMPTTWNPGNAAFHLLCWPCWTPAVDLSPLNTNGSWQPQRLGWVLPWGNAFAPGFQPNDGDPLNRMLKLFTDSAGQGLQVVVDAVQAGDQPGWQRQALGDAGNAQGNSLGNTQVSIDAAATSIWLTADPLTAPLAIRTNQPIFTNAYGIVEIGGETFAYKTDSVQDQADLLPATMPVDPIPNNQAWLIGRGLLGSSAHAHQGPELVLRLPIGPVAEVVTAMGADATGPLILEPAGALAAPAVLLTSRNGDQQELVALPNSHTAPWLRGLYNTTPVAWVERGADPTLPNLAPLAIGWWPRYPSGFPRQFDRSPEVAQYLRCRSYAWAGFPLRFHDCQFSGAGLAAVTVLDHGGGLFDVQALALDATMDWSAASIITLLAGGGTPTTTSIDASAAFNGNRFKTIGDEAIGNRLVNPGNTARPVDGAELRVLWSYAAARLGTSLPPAEWLQQAAANGSRAPMLGTVKLRTRAPNKVISVER